jgi:hypothetical protein
MSENKNQKGFVALFTVILVSVILAMAIGIASISLKEIVLSSSASEGNKSFYAADGGIECALFLTRTNLIDSGSFVQQCNGLVVLNFNETSDADANEVYTFSARLGSESELCANVTIKRALTNPGLGYSVLIESKGTNTACDDTTNNPKKVERSIRVTY